MMRLTWIAAIVLSAVRVSAATPENVYQPMGAPADPKVSVRWNRYHDYAEVTKLLKAMVKAHPQHARLQSLGKSYGDREMWLLTVTNSKTGDDRSKSAFWVGGGIHANEIQGTEVTLYTAWYLLEMYGRNPLITELVDRRTFYLLPMMSPDSRDAHMVRPNTTSSPRAGQRPVDDDRDGRVDEDPADDLDNDGHITQMRVRDPAGRYKPHEKYPHMMVRVEDDERGQYRLLGTEGFDNDGDGRVNEDSDGYYDPNRDWAWKWQPGHIQRGAYRYPFSILENRMAADFVTDHPNIAAAQHYHNTGGMILHGPGTKDDSYESSDVAVLKAIAQRGAVMLPGYRVIEIGTGLYGVYGGEGDWCYQMRGFYTFTNELFTSQNYFRKSTTGSERSQQKEIFDKYLLFGQGSVPWHEVDHPQYGKIEVGGFKKNWGRQPPSFLLEEECHRNMAFTLYHADQLPQIQIESIEATPAVGGLTQVTAVLINPKLTPTRTAVDVRRKITTPDLVSIEGKGMEVYLGMYTADKFFRNSTEQKRRPQQMRIPAVPSMGAVHVRWLVRGKGPFSVTVRSVKGGTARRQVTVQ
ncbi:MAG: peptidase M14 [Candidatus Nealsonbacteria bacterium]|nr:peptidase M14 [Candidatus Nealsonbacteria bacterium]